MQAELEIVNRLQSLGLHALGFFDCEGDKAQLFGNIGSSLWPAFSSSPEFADTLPDPMDRWTQRIVDDVLQHVGGDTVREVRYPFGDRIWPFQSYATKAAGIEQSPIGLLIHQEYGLWTAFRAVIVFNQPWNETRAPQHLSPCNTCLEKPCLDRCPVDAFSLDGFDHHACKGHLSSEAGQDCRMDGCKARLACPVGKIYRYQEEHQAFHMRAFVHA